MIRAALYARVSTMLQAREGDSIPAQRDAIRKYIDDHDDMVLAGEYIDDGASGTRADRDELTRLLEDVKAGRVDRILITKLDRLYRSIRHYLNMMDVLDSHGVGWTAIWEPIYDTTTPQGRLIVNQMMSIAQFEAENTGQRIRQVFDYKVNQGEVVSGSVPFGYSIVNKRLVPNEDADIVRDLFRHYNVNNNLSELNRYALNTYGISRCKTGMKRILTNKKYIGVNRNNKNFCEPIIDREVFESVNRKLSMNIKNGRAYEYIFSGMIRCAECGFAYAAGTESKTCGDTKHLYPRYRCAKHFIEKTCVNSAVIYESRLEKYLLENVRELLRDRKLEIKQREIKQKKKKDVVCKLEQKRDRLKELYLNGLITLDEYKTDRAALDAEIASHGTDTAVSAPAPIELPHDFEMLYNSLTVQERRRLWQGVIHEIRVDRDKEVKIIFL